MWLLWGTACMLGFLHAFEIDHMLAVTTFVSRRPAIRLAASFGLRWGVGHSIAVLLAGGLLLALGVRWPARYDAAGEVAVGAMLIGLGAWALRSAPKLHLHTAEEHGGHHHVHFHATHGVAASHRHPHEGPAGPAHAAPDHSHGGITAVGFLHGLSGTSAVVALVPITMLPHAAWGVGYLLAFGVGVTAAMTVVASGAALAMRQAAERSLIWGRRAASAIGLAAIVTGIWWIWTAVVSASATT